MELVTKIIGFLATIVGMSLMLPQVIKTIKTKEIKDVSLLMLIFYFFNCLLWLIYGILSIDWPLIICNTFTVTVSTIQLILKFKFSK